MVAASPSSSFQIPDAPWEVFPSCDCYMLRRPKRGDSDAWQVYRGATTTGMRLDKRDALALMDLLNAPRARCRQPGAIGFELGAVDNQPPRK